MTKPFALALAGIVLLGLSAGDARAAQAAGSAPDWRSMTELPYVDFTGLSVKQKKQVLDILRAEGCTCGCDMKLAECRVKDPKCSTSRPLAASVIKAVVAGKSTEEIHKAFAERASSPTPVLEAAVPISLAGDPSKGPADARLTLDEFSDYQCPYCAKAVGQIDAVLQKFPKDARLVFKQYPLSNHSQAALAAEASLAAHAQGKFWEMHAIMYAHFRDLSRDHIFGWAKQIGLNMDRFKADMDSHKFKAQVEKELVEGDEAGVEGTPTLYVNGQKYNGSLDPEAFASVLTGELRKIKR